MALRDPAFAGASHVQSLPSVSSTAALSKIDRIDRHKFDFRVLLLCIWVYLCAQVDRTNIGNARVLGLERDAQLYGLRFNTTLSVFFVTYIIFEIPSNLFCQKAGPRIVLGCLTIVFGLLTIGTAFVHSYHSFVTIRVLLGASESGIVPGIMYTLSKFYRRHEIGSRVGWLSAVGSLSGAVGGFLAAWLSKIPRSGQLHGWRWIFLIEGSITLVVGVCVFGFLPDAPSKSNFLSDEEKEHAITRLVQEQKAVSGEIISRSTFSKALKYLPTHLMAWSLFCSLCGVASISLFLPTLLKDMGYNGTKTQLMTIPPYVLAAITCVGSAFVSDRFRHRGIAVMILASLSTTGFCLMAFVTSVDIRYFGAFLATSGTFCSSPLILIWSVDNLSGPSVKAVGIAFIIGTGGIGQLVATWTYQSSGGPRYRTGHCINMSLSVLLFLLALSNTLYASFENKRRDAGQVDQSLTAEPISKTHGPGHRHPDFRLTP